jgi:sugar diacid utilization regulator
VLDRRHYGTVVVVELDHPALPQDISQHSLIVEQATTIVGSELLRQRSVEEAMERARGDFVHALLHGRFANPHDLIARAAHHDFDVSARYGVVTVHGLDITASGQSQTMSLVRRAEQVMQRSGVRALATVVDDIMVVIREVPAGASPRAEKNQAPALAEYAAALAQDLETRFGRPLTVTYGRPARGVPGIAESYREARMTLGVCVRLKVPRVSGYADLRVFAALAEVAASQQAREFAREVLDPLRRPGVGDDLERTVMAYVEAGGNLNAAARTLQLHRNTMLYKLDRVARLLGVDLREADNQFMVWLAYRIDLLSEVQSTVDERLKPAR